MTQDVLFHPAPADSTSPLSSVRQPPSNRPTDVVLAIGDTFVFRGLPGQQPEPGARTPGSGSVGWVLQVASLSPWGLLGLLCSPTLEGLDSGQVASLSYTEALVLIQHGAWEPLAPPCHA